MKIEQARDLAHSVGHKLQSGVELGMALKGIWDVGKTVYGGIRAAAPLLATIAM
jgi:hypothetical protein